MRSRQADPWLIAITACLTLLGLLMVFSSSMVITASSEDFRNDPFFFVKRQGIAVALGLLGLMVVRRLDLTRLRALTSVPFAIVTIGLLALVMAIGPEINGAKRWILVGPLQFQVAEMAKLALIFYLADALDRRREKVTHVSRIVPALGIFGIILLLVEQEPDLGTALVLAGVFMAMLFVAGARLEHLGGMAAAGVMAVCIMIIAKPFRMKRLATFVDPMGDVQGSGYQLYNSLLALASGGLMGQGLGNSTQKYNYLPEGQTDFIFAIYGEELGFIGTAGLCALFLALLYKGFKVAVQCRRPYLRLVAAGVTFQIALQALMNMAVASGMIPSTGVPLPFISYGGTSVLFSLISVGVLLNVADYNARQVEAEPKQGRRERRMREGSTLVSSSDETVAPISCGTWESRAAGQRLRRTEQRLPRPAVEPTLTDHAPAESERRERRGERPAKKRIKAIL
jgi:cell division protein FtsW